jgi:hypothetical protein
VWSALIFKNKNFLNELMKLDEFELDMSTKIKYKLVEDVDMFDEDKFISLIKKDDIESGQHDGPI